MRRYRRAPVLNQAVRADDDYWTEPHNKAVDGLTVYEPEAHWMLTGLLDADGQPMQAYVGPDPIGFLWHLSEDEE